MVWTRIYGVRLAGVVLSLSVAAALTAAPAFARSDMPVIRHGAAAMEVIAPEAVRADQLDLLRLSEKDQDIYRRIFAAQRKGDSKQAARLEKQLRDPSLLDWAHMRKTAPAIWLPQTVGGAPRIYHSPLPRDARQNNAADTVGISVALHLKTDDIKGAEAMVARASGNGTIDRIEAAQLWAAIASARLYNNDPRGALGLAHMALQIGGVITPEAAWTAGLSSWLNHDYRRAAQYFAWVPRSPYADPWLRSASSFWTARALMRTGNYREVSAWLREAAQHPRSFYGLIATRALGAKFEFNWSVPPLAPKHLATLKKYPGAVRALKLAQLGQMDMARLELQLLNDQDAQSWREALAALATAALKPDAAIQVANLLEHPTGGSVDTALYPIAPWQPKDGYRLDPALINAFIRQESHFKPAAQNKTSGATGLLQLMPRTARAVDKSTKKDQLKNPETSLMLGQKYLEELLERTDGNLFEAAMAYNAGPGNLASWKQRFAGVDDPLLFIELVPFGETRAYVERVMANYWIYSLRMGPGDGGGVATLDAVAGGHPARYARANNRDSTQIVLGAAQEDDSASSR